MTLQAALEREHRDIDDCFEVFLAADDRGADDVLRTGCHALRRHIYLEEVFLFPSLERRGLTMPLLVMRREHGDLWRRMDAVESQLDEGDRPGAAAAVESLLSALASHNDKEEPVIYPEADSGLDAAIADELGVFLGMGVMPADWVCEQARPHR